MSVNKSKTVIIAGGSRGIGAEISTAFYNNGDKVVIAARNDSGLAKKLGPRALFVKADLRRLHDAKKLIHETINWSGEVGSLINNVGKSEWKSLESIDEDFLKDMFDINLKSMFFTCQAVAPHLRIGGSIVNISSLAGKRGSANNSVYSATKFGVNGLTQSLSKELGKKGIRVNAICPVYVLTEGLENALHSTQSPAQGGAISDYLSNFAITQTALGTLPTASQIAATCIFLASPSAAAITGQCINVDCGVLPQ